MADVYINDLSAWCNITFSDDHSNPLSNAVNLYINGELATDITIPDSVTTIGDYAFSGCYSLTSVTIPSSVASVGVGAFKYCYNLTGVTIPISVTIIGDYAFFDCYNLTGVTIPGNVTTIGDYAFCGCYNLTSVTIPGSVASVGAGAFSGCTDVTGIWTDESNSYYISDTYGVLFNKEMTQLIQCPGGYCGAYTIPDSVSTIGESAFSGCDELTDITIPDSVTSIGDYAFSGCGLYDVKVGNCVTTIGDGAFSGCNVLSSVWIPGNNMHLDVDIFDPIFAGSEQLRTLVLGRGVLSVDGHVYDRLSEEPHFCLVILNPYCELPDRIAIMPIENTTIVGHYGSTAQEYAEKYEYNFWDVKSWCEHDDAEHVEAVEPDCINGGNIEYWYCDICESCLNNDSLTGHYYEYDGSVNLAPKGHAFETKIIEPTCTQMGYTSTVCTICGLAYVDDETEALGHAYETTVTHASCTDDGFTTYKCTTCGDSYIDNEVEALGHTYESSITVPSCTEGGFTTHTCATCGDSYVTDEVDALGHNQVIDEGYAADCENAGLSEGKHCSVCGEILVAQSEIPALGHAYEAVVTEATCTEDGFTTYTCSRCSDSYVADEIEALGHNYEAVVSGGNCSEFALTTYTCTNCNDSYIVYPYSEWSTEYPVGVNEELIETKEQYRYRSYDVVTSNEPLSDGYELMEEDWIKGSSGSVSYVTAWPDGFARGNNFYSVYNNPVPTAYKTDAAKRVIDNTSVAGYIYWHWCRNTYTAGPIDRGIEFYWTATYTTFHAFFSTTDPNTLYSDSWGCHQIANAACCKDTYWYVPLTVYKTDYTDYQKLYTYKEFGQWSDWSDETAELEGNYEHETRTLYRYVSGEYGDHVWDEGVNTIEPTCTKKGQITYTCTICGETDIAETEPVGHSYEAVVTAPTCTSSGFTTYTCANCNDSYTADETAPTGHKYHYTNNGANHTVGCDRCDYSVQQAHAFVNGTCICGAAENAEPIVDENLKFNMDISVGAEMVVNYNFMGIVVNGYSDFYLEVKKDVAGAQPVVTTFGVGEGHTPMASVIHPATGMPLLYNASYNGIAAKEMGDNFATTLYAIAADGKVYRSETVVSSIKNYLVSKINDANSIPEMKTMAVDMLNYGALAQIRFDYNAGMLANNTLTVAQAAYGTKGIPTAKDYYTVVGSGANVTANITVGSRVELSLSCIASGISDPSKVNCVIMDEEYKILANPEVTNIAGVMFYAKYDNVGAKEMRDLIRIMFYDGEKLISKITTWSVESYVAQTRVNPNATVQEINVANAMLTYGDSVAAYMSATAK